MKSDSILDGIVIIPCDTVTRDEDIQPERLSEKTRKGSDSLNSMETWRGRSEEVSPPAV